MARGAEGASAGRGGAVGGIGPSVGIGAPPSLGPSRPSFGAERPNPARSTVGHETGFVAGGNARRTGLDITNHFSPDVSVSTGFPIARRDTFSVGLPSGGAQVPASHTSLNMDPEEKRRLAEAAAKALTAK